jgi:hypothetical protein
VVAVPETVLEDVEALVVIVAEQLVVSIVGLTVLLDVPLLAKTAVGMDVVPPVELIVLELVLLDARILAKEPRVIAQSLLKSK